MKKTKSGWLCLSLAITIILIATCLPMGTFAEESGDNQTWFTRDDSVTTDAISDDGVMALELATPVIVFSKDVFYDGSSRSLAEIKPASGGPDIDSELVEITYAGTKLNGEVYQESELPPTDAGVYTVVAAYQGDEHYQSCSETKELKIKPAELKLTDFFTAKPIEKIYDGTTAVLENSITGLENTGVVKTDVDQVAFQYQSASFLSKDVKPAVPNQITLKNVTITGDRSFNYVLVADQDANKDNDQGKNVVANNGPSTFDVLLSANILPKPVDVFLLGQDKVYDGNADLHDYDFSINRDDVIAGEEIAIFTTDDFNPWYGEVDKQIKDVGEYIVWASTGFYFYGLNGTNGDNYTTKDNPISSREKYSITPASITVVPSYRFKVEGDDDPVLIYSVWRDKSGDTLTDGLFGNDVLYGTLEREAGEAVGKYDVYLGSLSNSNYYISFAQGEDKFEIIAKDKAAASIDSSGYYNPSTGTGAEEKQPPVAYFGIALLLLLLIVGGIFFGKNRLTKM